MTKLDLLKGGMEQAVDEGKLTPEQAVETFKQERDGQLRFKPRAIEDRIKAYDRDMQMQEMALNNRVPLFYPETELYLYPGFVMIGGVSGQGKSNVMANLIAGFIRNGGKKEAVLLTNEEMPNVVYNRIACVLTGLNFYRLQSGQMGTKERATVRAAVEDVAVQVEIVHEHYDMNCMEDVIRVADYAVAKDLGFLAMDYWQNVVSSEDSPEMESYRISKQLGAKMKEIGKRARMPIVALAQLKPGDEAHIKDRVENDKTIFNHTHQFLEMIPDFEKRETLFKIWKDRYGGQQGRELLMKYEHGCYVFEGGI